ncbi:hypothetical protein NUW58_g10357 [Xylaria curta]|uniref:Uncharacterized protein n=1 Tax=Xylaria curta TaxID=42375 RepID=A0ACC1MMF3_9PEZI|nr:hypothetical protein NUW58_g10357 [Xylaria curta]
MGETQDSSTGRYMQQPSGGTPQPTTQASADQPPPPQQSVGSGQLDNRPQSPTIRNSTPQPTVPHAEPTSSPRQQYLDSLQLPSDQDFARLCSLQEDRERAHRHRDNDLRRQGKIATRKSMEARREFMKSKILVEEEEKEKEKGPNETSQSHQGSIFSYQAHRVSDPHSPGDSTSADEDGGAVHGVEDLEVLKAKAATVIQRSYRGYRGRPTS